MGNLDLKKNIFQTLAGTFHSKFTASTIVTLVSAPLDEDTEDGDAVIIERQWDYQLRYLIAIGGRHFAQGSEVRAQYSHNRCAVSHFLVDTLEYPVDATH